MPRVLFDIGPTLQFEVPLRHRDLYKRAAWECRQAGGHLEAVCLGEVTAFSPGHGNLYYCRHCNTSFSDYTWLIKELCEMKAFEESLDDQCVLEPYMP